MVESNRAMKHKPRSGIQYCERMQSTKADYHGICFNCRKIHSNIPCTGDSEITCSCGSNDIRWIGPIARIPRKNASKAKWDEFWKHCGKGHVSGICR